MANFRATGILRPFMFAGGLALFLLGACGLAMSAEQPAPKVYTQKLPAPPTSASQPAAQQAVKPGTEAQKATQPDAGSSVLGQPEPIAEKPVVGSVEKVMPIPPPPPVETQKKPVQTGPIVEKQKQSVQTGLAVEKVTPPKAAIPGIATTPSLPSTGAKLPTRIPPEVAMLYNPKGKIDPFLPLFREETVQPTKESDADKKKTARKKRIPRTPLERLDLSQLKLAAIIMVPSGNKALVEEASGKGYIVKRGTFIGRDNGVVTAILKDRVIVREEVEDALGRVVVQNSEMKLQRPAGE